jgi:hypothetical protein
MMQVAVTATELGNGLARCGACIPPLFPAVVPGIRNGPLGAAAALLCSGRARSGDEVACVEYALAFDFTIL